MLRIHAFEIGILAACGVMIYTMLREDRREEERHELNCAAFCGFKDIDEILDLPEEPESE